MKLDQPTIAKFLTGAGVALGLAATTTDVFPVSWQTWIAVAAAAMTAAGMVTKKYAGNLIFTWIGIVFSVSGAVGPLLTTIHPKVAKVSLLIGVVAAALGKTWFSFDPSEPPKQDDGPQS